jgi:hypothetical protein
MDVKRLRQAVLDLGPRQRGRLFPEPLRTRLAKAARELRERGETNAEISALLGISKETARRMASEGNGAALVPVEIAAAPATRNDAELVVVSPTGWRVEGLDLDEAVALLRALS